MAMCLGFVFFSLKPEHICVHGHSCARTHTHSGKQISSQFSYATRLSELQLQACTVQENEGGEETETDTGGRGWPACRGQEGAQAGMGARSV